MHCGGCSGRRFVLWCLVSCSSSGGGGFCKWLLSVGDARGRTKNGLMSSRKGYAVFESLR